MPLTWSKLLSREGIDVTTASGIETDCYRAAFSYLGVKNEVLFTVCKNHQMNRYIKIDVLDYGKYLFNKFFNTDKKVSGQLKKGEKLMREVLSYSKNYQELIDRNSSDKQIKKAFKKFRSQFEKINSIYSMYAWFAINYWESKYNKTVEKIIFNNKHIDHDKLTQYLYEPYKKTALVRIQEDIKLGKLKKTELIQKYKFLRSWSLVWYEDIKVEWLDTIDRSYKSRKETHSNFIKSLKLSKEEKKSIDLAKKLLYLKDWRDELRRQHVYSWSFLFDMVADKINVNRNDLGYLSLDELEQLLNGNHIVLKEINQRKIKGCVVTWDIKSNKIAIITGVTPKYRNIIKKIDKRTESQSLTGMAAWKGKVKGKVMIINSEKDVKKMKRDYIMVSNTTHPSYLPAMMLAKGIITNEGGITSHAAIVARELKKPCVVNSKVATKILKNNYEVELDATNNKITIISKS